MTFRFQQIIVEHGSNDRWGKGCIQVSDVCYFYKLQVSILIFISFKFPTRIDHEDECIRPMLLMEDGNILPPPEPKVIVKEEEVNVPNIFIKL